MPYNIWAAITPSDTSDIAKPGALTAAIYVGAGGTVAAVGQDGTVGTFTAVSGEILPLSVKRVNSTGTTATGLVALYNL